ncbi:MAG: hydantoinase/oxoprolinase family protein [bacterium]|nr:hydantoinase/oxoprolinase family protein [bacterium]
METNVRVGIDVGGTFTHAVAIDNNDLRLLAHCVVPTSHKAQAGVAQGILDVFNKLIQELPKPCKVVFLAHSTTQATNALLEGDVAKVAVIGLVGQLEGVKAKADMNIGAVELAPGKYLHSVLQTFSADGGNIERQLKDYCAGLAAEGIGAVVAAQSFSVDDPQGEKQIMAQAAAAGLPACATHEMSGLYGLKVRTQTAVLNASILPKMIDTALMTEKALQDRVSAPLMIMRSDGGVMSLDEVRRRPVATLLSGPAAGIAACLMFVKASDALFVEVGGTSSDICLVKDGKAAVRSAQIGGHSTYLRTLDSRTLGVAGGSMLGWTSAGAKVGPRSAHVAGLAYCSFTKWSDIEGDDSWKAVEISPCQGDPLYFVLENAQGRRLAPTLTCAANLLGYIKEGDYGWGEQQTITWAFAKLAAAVSAKSGKQYTPQELAQEFMLAAAQGVMPTLRQLLKDYKMEGRQIKIIGGGGGAGAVVPFTAEKMGLPFEIAQHAEVISAIGAALAMVRETLERNIVNPSSADLAALRQEAEKSVLAMGADPATVEVTVEVDAQKSLVRATATGTVAFVAGDVLETDIGEDKRIEIVQASCQGGNLPAAGSRDDKEETQPTAKAKGSETVPQVQKVGETGYFHVYQSERTERWLLGLLKRRKTAVWALDGKGTVRLQVPEGQCQTSKGKDAGRDLEALLQKHTSYGDGGALIPAVHMLAGHRHVDFTSLLTAEQVMTLARAELPKVGEDEGVVFIVCPQV